MTKKYAKRSINGNAGEYLACFKFTKILNWPCRLQNIDIGVDAEIEICNVSGESTGDIVKLQIKSFQALDSSSKHDVYVEDKDILYWQRFSTPTIVVCVDLGSEKIYCKPIYSTEAYRTGGTSRKVTFDLNNDELTSNTKEILLKLASPEVFKKVNDLIQQSESIYKNITSSDIFDISEQELFHIENANREFNLLIEQIEEINRHYPWRISPFTAQRISNIKAIMRNHHSHAEVSWRNGINGM